MRRYAFFLLLVASVPAHADDWPQWLGPKRDGVWRETGLVDKFPEGGPKAKWRVPISEGYAGPAVVGGKVYVTDFVRAAGGKDAPTPFQRGDLPGNERVLCFDAASGGEPLWVHEYPATYRVSYAAGPRTTPLVHDGLVYTIGTMGDLVCLDAKTGGKKWAANFVKDLKAEVPVWGFSASPLIEGDLLICLAGGPKEPDIAQAMVKNDTAKIAELVTAGGGSLVVAYDRKTGKEVWRSLHDDEPGYAPPVVVDAGGTRQLIVWSPAAVTSLDPKTGKPYWCHGWPLKAGLSVPMVRFDAGRLFLTAFYNGSLMLELDKEKPAAKVLWKVGGKNERADNTRALHSIMPTPWFAGDSIYGVDSYGELRCLNAGTGDRLWSSLAATGPKSERWGTAFLVKLGDSGDRFVLFNEHGDLILADLSPKGYTEISRAKIIEPTNKLAGRLVVWTHPAFAEKCVFARNDKELVCVPLGR